MTSNHPGGRRRAEVVTTAALVLVTVTAAASFSRVFPGWSFLGSLLTVALIGHAASLISRRLGMRAIIALPLALAAVMVGVGLLHAPHTLWWGLPTGRTWALVRSDATAAWSEVGVVVPPLVFDGGFALVSLLAIGVAAVASDAIAFRVGARTEALVPTGLIVVTVSAVGFDRLRAEMTAAWLGTALVYAATARTRAVGVGWVGGRRRAGRAMVASGAVLGLSAACLAGVIGPRLPGADAEPLLEPRIRDSGSAPASLTPLVDITGRLADPSDAVLFSVRSDRPAYWRLAGLSDFDGSTWRLSAGELEGAGGDLDDARPLGTPLVQDITIARLGGHLVPVAATPTDLRSSDLDLYYAPRSGTLVVADPGLTNGARYQIVSSTPTPSAADLDAATTDVAPPDAATATLPSTWDPALTAVAERVTAGADTPYRRALALQDWFRGEFTYDLDVRLDTSVDAIAQFLEIRRGYCEQFAGAYAALARAIGLHARVAVGFTPGDRGADGAYRVRGRHAHAWPELWFDGIGWIGFEPTPGRGQPGAEAHTGVTAAQAERPVPVPPDATPDTTPRDTTPDAITGGAGATDSRPSASPSSSEPPSTAPVSVWRSLLGSWWPLPLLMVALWWWTMPWFVRRRIRAVDPDQAVVDDWNASVTAMRFAGVEAPASATPHEAAAHIARNSGLDRLELIELATAATTVLYGRTPLDPARRERSRLIGRHIRDSAIAVMPLGRRLRAHLDPRMAARLTRGQSRSER